MEHKFTDDEKILSLLKMSDDIYANAKLTPEEAKTLLDLINRQKAENEELQSEIKILKESNINLQELYQTEREKVAKAKQKVIDIGRALKTAKSEAIKEFAERLKEKIRVMDRIIIYGEDIDNLVKEMTEGKE